LHRHLRVATKRAPVTHSDGSRARPLANVLFGGEKGASEAKVVGLDLPDDVWAPCGVQFRLVNYIPMAVGNDLLHPSGHGSLRGTLDDYWTAIQKQPRFQDNTLTVVIAPWCSVVGAAAQGQLLPPVGQSLLDEHLACIVPGTHPNVLAHELGHVIMHDYNHERDVRRRGAGRRGRFVQAVQIRARTPRIVQAPRLLPRAEVSSVRGDTGSGPHRSPSARERRPRRIPGPWLGGEARPPRRMRTKILILQNLQTA
jgi:hypothetical protein